MRLTPEAKSYFKALLHSRVSNIALGAVAWSALTFGSEEPAAFWGAVMPRESDYA